MDRLTILIAVVTIAVGPSIVLAQPMTERGDNSLSLHIDPDLEGAVGDMIDIEASYGRFVRDRFELAASFEWAVLEDVAGEDSDYRTSQIGVSALYHFGGGRFVTYVGAGVGWRRTHFGEVDETGLVYGPRLGFEYFVADNVAIEVQIAYQLGAADVFVNDFVAEDSDLSQRVGIRFFF